MEYLYAFLILVAVLSTLDAHSNKTSQCLLVTIVAVLSTLDAHSNLSNSSVFLVDILSQSYLHWMLTLTGEAGMAKAPLASQSYLHWMLTLTR